MVDRKANIDLLRVISAAAIVTLHSVTAPMGNAWGIYLLHPLIINVALKVLKMDFVSYMPYVKIPLLAICTFTLSFAITYLLRKIPFVSELF